MKFFKKEDMSCLMELDGRKAKYVAPTDSRAMLACYEPNLHKLAKDIVRSLRVRNFDVPGFECEFVFLRETGEVRVREVRSDNFRFSSTTLEFGNYRMSLFDDNSGSVDVFIGGEEDMPTFKRGLLHHRKMNGLKKIHLQYHKHYGHTNVFKHVTDSREYMPDAGEPTEINILDVQMEARTILKDALSKIKSVESPKMRNIFEEPAPVSVSCEHLPEVLYGFRTSRHDNAPGLVPNRRLISLSSPRPTGHKYEGQMNEGFVYMETKFSNEPVDSGRYNYGMGSWGDEVETYEVRLSKANGIYVIDASVFYRLKDEYFENNPAADRLPDDSFREFGKAEAATMVAINDYDGTYVTPVVISVRHIGDSELKLVSKRKNDFYLERDRTKASKNAKI